MIPPSALARRYQRYALAETDSSMWIGRKMARSNQVKLTGQCQT